jgi:endonuclease IV
LKTLIIHASHRVNLASQGNQARGILQSTLNKLSKALEFNEKLKLGVVVHVGRGAGANMDRVIEQTTSLNIPEGVTLYMENAAGQGHEIGKNPQELEELFESLPSKIRLCIDTQHSFAAGICQWKDAEEVDDFIRKIDERMPYRLRLFHLNDSKTEFGSRVDRHEKIGAGKIWGEEKEGLLALLDVSVVNKIPMILETPLPGADLDRLFQFWDKNSAK